MRAATETHPERGRPDELVVLLDPSARAIGSAEKRRVHTATTPLHLAFSCYLLNDEGEVLVTRRALAKATWPGVWTNSFCGHPAPGELSETAVARRAAHELGVEICDLRLVLADFRYRAVDASGVVENEVCPVYLASVAGELRPHPDEVAEWRWVRADALLEAVRLSPFAFSPWMSLQLPRIEGALLAAVGPRSSTPGEGAS